MNELKELTHEQLIEFTKDLSEQTVNQQIKIEALEKENQRLKVLESEYKAIWSVAPDYCKNILKSKQEDTENE